MAADPAQFENALRCYQQGRLSEAEALFRDIIREDKGCADAYHHLGLIALQRHQNTDALNLIAAALAIAPDNAAALNTYGAALMNMGRPEEALASYGQALAITPDFADAFFNRGNAFLQLKRFHEALVGYDQAVAIKPDFPEAFYNRGKALVQLDRLQEALTSFERALAIRPGYVEALNSQGNVLLNLGRSEEALAVFDRALAIRPDFVEGLYNRANTLLELKRLDEALASFDRAIELKPDLAEAHCNRGVVLSELRRLDDAMASYRRALTIKPDYSEVTWNESRCHLLVGDFEPGWKKAEARWLIKPLKDVIRKFEKPLWQGESALAGKTLLLHADQGFGDTIQFCRYATDAAQRGARVVLEVQDTLKSLLQSLSGVSAMVTTGDPLPAYDFHCPFMSLPLAFKTSLATIPAEIPYLRPAPELVDKWKAKLGAQPGLRVGLAWSGSPSHNNDRHRSLAAHRLSPLLASGASLVSLQKHVHPQDRKWLGAHPQIRLFDDELDDFADTAALASLMNVVVSVDTSVAHLAGATGHPVWIMLSYLGLDRRWMLDRDDSPWYPTARLYRQRAIDAWDEVLVRVCNDLRAMGESKR